MSLRLVWKHTTESWEYTIPVDGESMHRLVAMLGEMERFEQQEAFLILCEYLAERCAAFSRRRQVPPTRQMIWMTGYILAHSTDPIVIPDKAVQSREAAREFIRTHGHVLSPPLAGTTIYGKPRGNVAPQSALVARRLKRIGVQVPTQPQPVKEADRADSVEREADTLS